MSAMSLFIGIINNDRKSGGGLYLLLPHSMQWIIFSHRSCGAVPTFIFNPASQN